LLSETTLEQKTLNIILSQASSSYDDDLMKETPQPTPQAEKSDKQENDPELKLLNVIL